MIKLSIIIPLYNVEKYVSRAANSIASQDFDGLEVVLVDDGSTDDSLAVCKSHLGDTNVVVLQQANQGPSTARNNGIMAASGKYIMFLDSDDFILPNGIKNICCILEKEKPDVLFGTYRCWTEANGLFPNKSYNYEPPTDPEKRTEYILSSLPQFSWNAWRYVCRRELIVEKNLFFEPKIFCEDVPWTVELLENTGTISFLQEPFYAYFQHRPGSIMSSLSAKRLIDLNYVVSRLVQKYKGRPVICSKLIDQSFFYINEYCAFKGKDRKDIYESYKNVLPLYASSPSPIHQLVGRFQKPFCLYILSLCIFSVKHLRRSWKGSFAVIVEKIIRGATHYAKSNQNTC